MFEKNYSKNPENRDLEFDRLAHSIFNKGLQVLNLKKELRNEIFVGFAVAVGLAIDLDISNATQPQPETIPDDDDTWNTTSTNWKQNSREGSTQTEMEPPEVAFSPEFYFPLVQLVISWQKNMLWTIEHLKRGQEV